MENYAAQPWNHHCQVILSNNILTLLDAKYDSKRRSSHNETEEQSATISVIHDKKKKQMLSSTDQLFNLIHLRISKIQRIKKATKRGILVKQICYESKIGAHCRMPSAWNWPYQCKRDLFSEQYLKRKRKRWCNATVSQSIMNLWQRGSKLDLEEVNGGTEERSLKSCTPWRLGDTGWLKSMGMNTEAFHKPWVQTESHPAL